MKKTNKEVKKEITGKMLTMVQALTVRDMIIANVRDTFMAGGMTLSMFETEFMSNTIRMAEDIVLSTQRALMQQGTVDNVIQEGKQRKTKAVKKVTKKIVKKVTKEN